MEKYVELLKNYLNGKRDYTKTMFKIMATIYRGVNNGRFTLDDGLKAMKNLGGTANG